MRIRIGRTYVSRCGDVSFVFKNDHDSPDGGYTARLIRKGHATECSSCAICPEGKEFWLGPDGRYWNRGEWSEHDVVGQINKCVSKKAISQMELEAAMHFMAWCKENGVKIR